MELRPPFILTERGSEQGVFSLAEALTDHIEAAMCARIHRVFDSTGHFPRTTTIGTRQVC